MIFHGLTPGIPKDQMVAIIGVTEKGFVTLKVKAKGQVGHSSIAPEETAITTLAKAVSK